MTSAQKCDLSHPQALARLAHDPAAQLDLPITRDGAKALQRVQIISYHATSQLVAPGDAHSIEDAAFDRHLALLAQEKIHVLNAADLTRRHHGHDAVATAFTFDDGCISDLRNADKLRARGWNGIFFISTGLMGTPGFVSPAEVRELAELGMTIGSHAHQHVRLTTLPRHQVAAQLKQSKAILEDTLSCAVDHFSFPGGAYDEGLLDLARQAGYKHIFGTAWGPVQAGMPPDDGVYRRNNIMRHMSDAEVLKLVQLKNHHWRTVVHAGKSVLNRCLPDAFYRGVRDSLIRA